MHGWPEAEAQIRAELAASEHRYCLILVKAGGVLYTGKYDPHTTAGYRPGEIQPGYPVSVHLEDDRKRVKLPDGKELDARVVRAART